MAGQRQKPRSELSFKRGGRGGSVLVDVSAAERIEMMEPPEGLPLSPDAQQVWRMVVPTLSHIHQRELPVLLRYITWVSLWWQALRTVEALGMYGDGGLSAPFRALERAEVVCERLETKLGLEPQARMRLGLSAIKEESALQRLRGGADVAERKPPARL